MLKPPPPSSVNQGLQLILSKKQLGSIRKACVELIHATLDEIQRRDCGVYESQKHIKNTECVDLEHLLFRVSLLHNILNTIKSYSHLSGEHR